jgi:hypothetical protein
MITASWGAFRVEQHDFYQLSRHAPKALNISSTQAEKATGVKADLLWGCASDEFHSPSAVLWNEIGLCSALKAPQLAVKNTRIRYHG